MKYTKVPSLQETLEKEIDALAAFFSSRPIADIEAVELIGSVSEGLATYRSDIDLLVILSGGALTFERVSNLKLILEKK